MFPLCTKSHVCVLCFESLIQSLLPHVVADQVADKAPSGELQNRLTMGRSELASAVHQVKHKAVEFNEEKSQPSPNLQHMATIEQELVPLKKHYSKCKSAYEALCIEVFEAWKVSPQPPSTCFRGGGLASLPATLAPPKMMAAATVGHTFTSPSSMEGNSIEFMFADTSSNGLMQAIERECGSLTKMEQGSGEWATAPPDAQRETDWETHNILSKQEIEEREVKRLKTRLCSSTREHEFISRAGEEISMKELHTLVAMAKHRAESNNGNSHVESRPVCIVAEDVRTLMRDPKSLLYLLHQQSEYY